MRRSRLPSQFYAGGVIAPSKANERRKDDPVQASSIGNGCAPPQMSFPSLMSFTGGN